MVVWADRVVLHDQHILITIDAEFWNYLVGLDDKVQTRHAMRGHQFLWMFVVLSVPSVRRVHACLYTKLLLTVNLFVAMDYAWSKPEFLICEYS